MGQSLEQIAAMSSAFSELGDLRAALAEVSRLDEPLAELAEFRTSIEQLSSLKEPITTMALLQKDLQAVAELREPMAQLGELAEPMAAISSRSDLGPTFFILTALACLGVSVFTIAFGVFLGLRMTERRRERRDRPGSVAATDDVKPQLACA